jgi:hypothetical protein
MLEMQKAREDLHQRVSKKKIEQTSFFATALTLALDGRARFVHT